MPIHTDDEAECDIVWEIASKLYTREMVSINLLFDGRIIKRFAKFYADISDI